MTSSTPETAPRGLRRTLSRRAFVVSGVGGVLAVGVSLRAARPATAQDGPPPGAAGEPDAIRPDAWVSIAPDGTTTVKVHKAEMGQGVMTALPMLVAEELDADWAKVVAVPAYGDPAYGSFGMQFTFGSMSVLGAWQPLREAGAAMRAMLVAAAAKRWGVPEDEIRTADGEAIHDGSGRRIGYGDLAAEAATMPVPAEVTLKAPADWTLIGTPVPRLDAPSKTDGSARFAIDVREPGMLTATILRSPQFGATLAGYDEAAALAVPGVRQVLRVGPNQPGGGEGIAVVADGFWPAKVGRDALNATWTPGPNAGRTSEAITAQLRDLAARPGPLAFAEGDAEAALGTAAKRLETAYDLPFLAHTTMEPMTCAAKVGPDGAEIWVGTQGESFVLRTVAELTGLPPEKNVLHQLLMGCGLGRRAQTDYVADAVLVAQAAGAPVKVVWPRDEDLRHDAYRPATAHQVRAGLDADGRIVAWAHRTAGPALGMPGQPFFGTKGPAGDLIDGTMLSALGESLLYPVPHHRVEAAMADTGVPTGFWRGVGSTQNLHVVECVVDELAALAGADPLAFRRRMLAENPRAVALLDRVAADSGWGDPLPAGRGRGVAIGMYGPTMVALVVQARVDDAGTIRVERATAAVDCGPVVNPAVARQQVEGGIVFGLSAALGEEVRIADGGVAQGNFDTYRLLRNVAPPEIAVAFVPSPEVIGGLGEPATVVTPPALANAVFAATGKRVRVLPLA